tara:strand:+ start:516 stop:851 length:336 start_codon:yes stop_codon:yes gene_type:complete
MKHLLSILILFGLTYNALAEEIYLGCWNDGSDELIYEIDINLEQNKLWKNDHLYELDFVSDKYITANISSGAVRITINRYTGELTEGFIKTDGTPVEIFKRLNCKQLEQLF